jgi:hypothetical protein
MIALAEEKKLKQVMSAIERAGGTAFMARKTDIGAQIEP